MPTVEQWASAFAWTLALELPLYAFALRRRVDGWLRLCALVLALNLATHPALWFLYPATYERFPSYAAWLAVGEAGVTVIEATLLALALRWIEARWSIAVAAGAALAANAFSTAAGGLLQWVAFDLEARPERWPLALAAGLALLVADVLWLRRWYARTRRAAE